MRFQTYQTRSGSIAGDAVHFLSHFGGLHCPREFGNVLAGRVLQAILLVAHKLQTGRADLVTDCNWALQKQLFS